MSGTQNTPPGSSGNEESGGKALQPVMVFVIAAVVLAIMLVIGLVVL